MHPQLPALSRGLAQLQLDLHSEQQQQLLAYADLLLHWNKRFNLIGRSTEADVLQRHILDSLSIQPCLLEDANRAPRWIDVGSGAGLPGIPLAIACPEVSVTLLDSKSKKTHFLLQAVAELGLTNTDVVHSRVEDYQPETPFDRVISRAWAAMADGLALCRHLCAPGGRLCFMKGQRDDQELRDAVKQFTLARCTELTTRGEARHLFEFKA